MLLEGHIYYFDPFYFKNGNTAKPKYGLVIKRVNDDSLILSLPTRKDHIPSFYELTKDSECIELPDANQNCFFFSNQKEITECGKKFQFNTFVYGHELDLYEKTNTLYPAEGIHYKEWGKMKADIFSLVIDCFKNSASVKRKFKRMI